MLAFSTSFILNAREPPKGIYIINAQNKLPDEDAFVQTEDAGFNGSADENGFVSFAGLDSTVIKLHISHIGFEPRYIELSSLCLEHYIPIVYLQASVANLAEVFVKGTAPHQLCKPIGELDIHLRPINHSQDILRVVPGLFTGQHAGGGKAEQIFLRGFDADHGTDIHDP